MSRHVSGRILPGHGLEHDFGCRSSTPAGDYKYSDLGFYMWDKVLKTWGMDIEDWVQPNGRPDGMAKHGLQPAGRGMPRSEHCPERMGPRIQGGEVRGTVHDPGAAMMGGVACHAGLFSNAYDLAELGETWLRAGVQGRTRSVPEDVLDQLDQSGFPDGDNRRGLVFDKPALEPDSGPPATSRLGRALATPDSPAPWCGWIRRTIWSMCF